MCQSLAHPVIKGLSGVLCCCRSFTVGARLSRPLPAFVPPVIAGTALQGWLMWRYSVGEWTF